MPTIFPNLKLKRPTDANHKKGFSLIELLVVIGLFGLISGGITVSFLSFEKNQKLLNSALTLKADIRLAQGKAQTGDKVGNSGQACAGRGPGSTLLGWYLFFNPGSSTYQINGRCTDILGGVVLSSTTMTLPSPLTIKGATYNGAAMDTNNAHAFFVAYKPLGTGVYIYLNPNADFSQSTPITFNSGSVFRITLWDGVNNYYYVDINPFTGGVDESKT